MNRRHFILSASLVGAAGLLGAGASTAQAAPQTILVVGDSLSAEYGLKRGEGWVALLQQRLVEQKIDARVVNASISGETTSGGRSRIDALLKLNKPDVVVLELGANDALRGLPIKASEVNLTTMTKAAQAAGAKVLLLGMQVPPNYGMDYLNRFSRMFSATGSATGAPVVPFLLKGVADGPDPTKMFQADRVHPVAAAHPQMLDNVWPQLRKLLK